MKKNLKELIQEIEKIDDDFLIEEIGALLKETDESMVGEFNVSQQQLIRDSQLQIKEGKYQSHADVMKALKNG